MRACNPIDYVARRINGKNNLPPLHLRWEVGPLRGFETAGSEFRIYLKLFADLKPSSHFLDVGCGCGQVALQIADHLDSNGKYMGYDIQREAIAWCEKHISRNDRRFSFYHMDVKNGLYNPGGSVPADRWKFPDDGHVFDVILLKSVFTHMLRDEVANYLSQVPSLLCEQGKCMATFFLLNDRQRALARENRALMTFVPGEHGASHANPDIPESIVAYEETDVLEMIHRSGLRLARPIEYGNWTGDMWALSHQDIVVLEHER